MKKIGLTGGTGFIGQYLLRDYSDRYEFIVPIRKNKQGCVINKNIEYKESDYSADSLSDVFYGCDAVINLAARQFSRSTKGSLLPGEYIENISICANVFEACKMLGIKRVVFSSSNSACDRSKNENMSYKESDIAYPLSEYGLSKLCGETIAQFYNDMYDMDIVCYRIVEVCGLAFTGCMHNPFWNECLRACEKKEPIILYGDGQGKRDLVYVKDVCQAIIHGINSHIRGIYNLGLGYLITNREIAEEFLLFFNNEKGVVMNAEKAKGGINVCMCVDKIYNEIKFSPKYCNLEMIMSDIKREYNSIKGKNNE